MSSIHSRRIYLLAVILAAPACASAPGDGALAFSPIVAAPPRREARSNQIDGSEMRHAQGTTVEDAIRQLRPAFLQGTPVLGERGMRRVAASVYVDGTFTGAPDVLRTIPISAVVEVRRLSPSAARDWFGNACQCEGGVLLVTTKP